MVEANKAAKDLAEGGILVNTLAAPSQLVLLQKEFKEQKEKLRQAKV
jgi:hypothetical protein